MPLGDKLRDQIAALVKHEDNHGFVDPVVASAVDELCGNDAHKRQEYMWAAHRLEEGLDHVGSIDAFLEIHHEDTALVELGKLGIALAILRAERTSALAARLKPELFEAEELKPLQKRYRDSWYVPFGKLLTQGVSRADVEQIYQNVSFITFNYDRCIETFAEFLLRGTYGLGDYAREVARSLEVLHAYGAVGEVQPSTGSLAVPFGSPEGADVVGLSKGIKTFTETVESEVSNRIKSRIRDADTIVFLGFGWLPENLALLACGESYVRRVFYTTKGVSQADLPTVRRDLATVLGRKGPRNEIGSIGGIEEFEEVHGCANLFADHMRQLRRS